MPPLPHVTILMAVRDGARHLRAQLDSIAGQIGVTWALWVSDDGSSDDTRSIVRTFATDHTDCDIRLFDGPRRGSAANFLSLLCRDDRPETYIALADQDDVWRPDKLSRAVRRIGPPEGAPRLYGARWVIVAEDLAPIAFSAGVPKGPSLENALVQNVVSGHTTVMTPAMANHIRNAGTVDIPFHDWWIYQVATAIGAKVILDDYPVLDYRQHDANVAGTRRGWPAGVTRFRGLLDGTMARWMRRNRAALETGGLPLSPAARHLLTHLPRQGPIRPNHLRRLGLHRQTTGGTAALYLAAALGRL